MRKETNMGKKETKGIVGEQTNMGKGKEKKETR